MLLLTFSMSSMDASTRTLPTVSSRYVMGAQRREAGRTADRAVSSAAAAAVLSLPSSVPAMLAAMLSSDQARSQMSREEQPLTVSLPGAM
jgi:hypothetical protein